jgi:hypothetical protein
MTRRRRLLSPALWVAIPLVVLIGVAAFLTFRQTHQQAVAAERISNLEATVTALANALKSEQTATKNAGGQPVTAPADQIASTASTVGPAGEKGDKGDRGPIGPPGPAGAPGVPGQTGATGQPGKDGTPGGPAGPQGQRGPAGPAGMTGPAGAVGPVGATGSQGEAGPAGAQGPAGPAGAPGPGPSDDQVAAAVAAYCAAHNGCMPSLLPPP